MGNHCEELAIFSDRGMPWKAWLVGRWEKHTHLCKWGMWFQLLTSHSSSTQPRELGLGDALAHDTYMKKLVGLGRGAVLPSGRRGSLAFERGTGYRRMWAPRPCCFSVEHGGCACTTHTPSLPPQVLAI